MDALWPDDLSQVQWGPVSAWVGSILTAGSLWLGFSILKRDRKVARQKQAAKFLCWYTNDWDYQPDPNYPWKVDFQAHNTSRQIVVNAFINIRFNPKAREESQVESSIEEILNEGVKRAIIEDAWGYGLSFSDNTGKNRVTEFTPDTRAYCQTRLPAEPARYHIQVTFMDAKGDTWLKELTGRKRLIEFKPKRVFRARLSRTGTWLRTR